MKTTLQPAVTVRVPEVKLRLEDLTYLRSLSGDQKIKCAVSDNQLNRLRILGLVEDKDIPAAEQDVNEADFALEQLSNKLQVLLSAKDYNKLANFETYNFREALRRKASRRVTVLTEVGRELLLKGEVRTKVAKLGCL